MRNGTVVKITSQPDNITDIPMIGEVGVIVAVDGETAHIHTIGLDGYLKSCCHIGLSTFEEVENPSDILVRYAAEQTALGTWMHGVGVQAKSVAAEMVKGLDDTEMLSRRHSHISIVEAVQDKIMEIQDQFPTPADALESEDPLVRALARKFQGTPSDVTQQSRIDRAAERLAQVGITDLDKAKMVAFLKVLKEEGLD